MLKSLGHTVYHYGNEESEVECDEHISVTTREDLIKQYGDGVGRTQEYKFDIKDPVYIKFYINTINAINERKQANDFLLCFWGVGHKAIAELMTDMIVVEPGIGYGGTFARWKIFESYAMLHAWSGIEVVNVAGKVDWYNVVIPNYFDPADFTFSSDKKNYLLFLGRMGEAKGLDIAAEAAKATNTRLIAAGAASGEYKDVEFVGFADWETRRGLLAGAKALIAPSRFIEPFCGVLIEAALSGTPVITIDWGAATETVLHGITGYRCRTFDHFTWAVNNIHHIKPQACLDWAQANYSMDRVRFMYEEYFNTVMDVYVGKGWYQRHPNRTELDWLSKEFPNDKLSFLRPSQKDHRPRLFQNHKAEAI